MIVTDTMAIGGTEKLSALLADGFINTGNECCVMVLNDKLDSTKLIHSKKVIVEYAFHRYPMHFNYNKVRRVIRKFSPEIILCQNLFSYISVKIAAINISRIPIFIVLHYTYNYAFKDEMFDRIYFFLVRNSKDRIICIYDQQRKHFSEKHNIPIRRFSLIYNGIDIEHFHPKKSLQPNSNILRIVHIGNMKIEKDQLTLLRAIKILNMLNPNWELEFIGRDEAGLMMQFNSFIAKNNLEDKVKFHKNVSDPAGILRNSDVFVMSSISEAFPVSALEAMASGIPCILTNVGGCKEIVDDGENGYILPPYNSEAIAEKLLFLAQHRNVLNHMAKKAREKAEREYSCKKMVERYLSVFRRETI